MKKYILFILFLGLLQSTFAQQELKRANHYFERAFYSDAIPLYENLITSHKNSKLIKNLADCYYNTYDMKSAARWYSYLISNYGDTVNESYHFKLNQALKAIGETTKASETLIKYYNNNDAKEKANLVSAHDIYIENISAIGNRFNIKNLGINTAKSEFGAIAIDSNLIFAATKKETSLLNKVYKWNNEAYLDLYKAPLTQIHLGDTISKSLSKNINTKMHEGVLAITKDRKTIYFTRNNFIKGKKKTDGKKVSNLKIYKAEFIDNEWKNITELPFNGDDFSTAHPALSPDEKTLFFSSDREGGYGSYDIYATTINNDGTYGEPKNLGTEINTDKKEQFPFLDANGNLYFSSNGLPGFGLLDVFIAVTKNGKFQKPDNIGLPVNSSYDDFSFSTIAATKKGFFSSNRPQGKGSDDVYEFVETKPLIIEDCKQTIVGILVDKTTEKPIPFGSIEIVYKEQKKKFTTGADASFKFIVGCNESYTITGSKIGYEPNTKIVYTSKERNKVNNATLKLFSLFEKEKEQQIAMQKEREEKAEKEKAEKEKALKQKKESIKSAINNESAIVKTKEKTIIKTEPINFDYNMWYLRQESRTRLSRVINIMNKYPNMIIEIGTHTDRRGNNTYNKNLSQKRANSVRTHLIKEGIAANRVRATGYGELKPVIKCKTDDSCSEEEHELNRRCEIVIVKWE